MIRTKFTNFRRAVTLVIAVAYAFGLQTAFAGSQKSSKLASPKGNDKGLRTNRAKQDTKSNIDKPLGEIGLRDLCVSQLKSGKLPEGLESLKKLVAIAPDNTQYLQILERAKKQLQQENWYKFQMKNLEEFAPDSNSEECLANTTDDLKVARQKFNDWVASIKWEHRP